jgi:TatD DNase family protein
LPKIVLENQLPFTVGLHPWFVPESETALKKLWPQFIEQLEKPFCTGLGECGLDRLKGPDFSWQQVVLKKQFDHALEHNTPLMVLHCVRAYPECLQIIKESHYRGVVVFHDYGANPQISEQILAFENCYFSLGKALERDAFLKRTLPLLPLNRLLLETDDESNLSIEVRYRQLSEAKGLSLEEITTSLYKNTQVILNNLSL